MADAEETREMTFTGERFVPGIGGPIVLEHVHRYLLACELAEGRAVLDIACGEGYGSAMLSRVARHVVGVDISEESIAHAKRRYPVQNIDFKVGSADRIPLADGSVDLVVSFETIEHHDRHAQMLAEIKRVLRPEGVLVISSPDKREYSDLPGYANPHHVRELYREEFVALIAGSFAHRVFLGQRVLYGSQIGAEGVPTAVRTYRQGDGETKGHAGVLRPVYLIAVASDGAIPPLSSGVLEDAQFVQSLEAGVAQRDAQIAALDRDAALQAGEIARLTRLVFDRDADLQRIRRSIFWPLADPRGWRAAQRQRADLLRLGLPALLADTGGPVPLARALAGAWRRDGLAGVKSLLVRAAQRPGRSGADRREP